MSYKSAIKANFRLCPVQCQNICEMNVKSSALSLDRFLFTTDERNGNILTLENTVMKIAVTLWLVKENCVIMTQAFFHRFYLDFFEKSGQYVI